MEIQLNPLVTCMQIAGFYFATSKDNQLLAPPLAKLAARYESLLAHNKDAQVRL